MDTSSRLNAWAGGRVFPGTYHRARFQTQETAESYDVRLDSLDGATSVHVRARIGTSLPTTSIFNSLEHVSEFFAAGSLGFSPTPSGQLEGLELETLSWRVQPLEVESVQSSFFEDRSVFPHDSVAFDNALLMERISHRWHRRQGLAACCS